eukprot:CAMPEP_0177779138 /NCGR_PEP_ID=MMETSP0491_2-20121128/16395_1 /TAXON_ID=63592 /ORGANISM="Tetraselmis chuii, Strain PLY429" /LENGTH=451 /DNA_ID=CAMNT_0019298593 /DNA_START=174 /DNA_END=1529 /DNA_ORIENTATION=+
MAFSVAASRVGADGLYSTARKGLPVRSRAARASRVCCSASRDEETLSAKVSKGIQQSILSVAAAATVLMPSSYLLPDQVVPRAEAVGQKTNLPNGDPTKNAKALLRDALPIQNKPIRMIQKELESVAEALRVPGSKSLGPISRAVRKAEQILKDKKGEIVGAFAKDKADAGLLALVNLSSALAEFDTVLESQDKQEVPIIQQKCLDAVGAVEEAMVDGFPFIVPEEYSNLPQLKGRATLQMDLKFNKAKDALPGGSLTIVLDGYSAPVTAGNFMDLVNRGFYNGMEIQRADGFVVQTGDPDGPAVGFVDPKTKETRTIPFEVLAAGDADPTYGDTLEDLGRFQDLPVLPFNAFGTLAMARSESDPNSGSSQIFFLLKESELTPSGANLLDGRYAVFGYIIEGQDLLTDCSLGDKITSIKVLKGQENLVLPDSGPIISVPSSSSEAPEQASE